MKSSLVGSVHWRWLNYHIGDHIIIDVWRYGLVLLAFFSIGAGIFYWRGVRRKIALHSYMVIINTLVAILFILQEVEQFGKPMLVWRLPYETVVLTFIWAVIRASHRLREEGDEHVGR
jgi:hypothetical protein